VTRAPHLRDESGFTLIELLIATTLMLIVLGATLTTLDNFVANSARNTKTQDQQEIVRRGMDRLTKQLRNLANPTNGTGATIGYADDYRLVFQTTDPSRQWVAYCLDTSVAANEKLWYRTSTTSTAPTNLGTDTCPGTAANGWNGSRIMVSDHVTNANGQTRPLFNYETHTGPLAPGSAVSLANRSKIIRVATQIYIDLKTNQAPPEIGLSSGVHLRNQNQAPSAQFTASFAAAKTWVMNAGASVDPEGTNMQYTWYRETGQPTAIPTATSTPTLNNLPNCTIFPPETFSIGGKTWTCMGTGVILSYDFGAVSGLTSPTNVWLRTTDSGKLAAFSAAGTTTCPTATQTTPVRTDNQCQQIPF
jgi:prepilin-type N-terminal cleavage/methylation domain-containing protein